MPGMRVTEKLRAWARRVKRDGVTLWFALRHPATPWPVKAIAAVVVAYALSPIDLIPDYVPVLGYVDDVLLLPGLIWAAVRLLPDAVYAECRARADDWLREKGAKPRTLWGVLLVCSVWAAVAWLVWRWWAG